MAITTALTDPTRPTAVSVLIYLLIYLIISGLQFFDAVGWAAGTASGL